MLVRRRAPRDPGGRAGGEADRWIAAVVDLLAGATVGAFVLVALRAWLSRHLPTLDAWDRQAVTPAAVGGFALGVVAGCRRGGSLAVAGAICAALLGAVLPPFPVSLLPGAQPVVRTVGLLPLLGSAAAGALGGIAGWSLARRALRRRTLPRGAVLAVSLSAGAAASLCAPLDSLLPDGAASTVPGLGSDPPTGLVWLVAAVAVASSTRLPHPPLWLAAAGAALTAAAGRLGTRPDWPAPAALGYGLLVGVAAAVTGLILQAVLEEWNEPKGRRQRRVEAPPDRPAPSGPP